MAEEVIMKETKYSGAWVRGGERGASLHVRLNKNVKVLVLQ
jgi:hypothetical protein